VVAETNLTHKEKKKNNHFTYGDFQKNQIVKRT